MACVKLGSKSHGFDRRGQAWFCTSGLPCDVVIGVEEMSFHLHKFPLVSRSGKLARLIREQSESKKEIMHLQLHDIPGGPNAFELAAKFCYGVRLELTAANVVFLRCAAEYLEMTEEFGEGNLIAQTEGFLSNVILQNWKECTRALQSCETVLSHAEELGIVDRCLNAVISMACTDPSLLGWPMSSSMQSPGGSFLWNGISTGAHLRKPHSDWRYDDISELSLPLYHRVIIGMQSQGIKPDSIAEALMHYGRRYLPALNKRQGMEGGSGRFGSLSLTSIPSDADQRAILERIEALLPMQKGLVSTRFLSGLLRSAMILDASAECKANFERRIGAQLDQASLEDLLMPSLSYNLETLYDIDYVHRILAHFFLMDQSTGPLSSPGVIDENVMSSSSLTPMMMVARLIDGYLAEVASDANLKISKFLLIAEALPEFSRISDDGLYRAIDIYLKLQLRTAIASCFMVSDGSRPLGNEAANDALGGWWANAIRDNQMLKVDMDQMKLRVSELERECLGMKEEIDKLRRQGKLRFMSYICSRKQDSVHDQARPSDHNQVSPHHPRQSEHRSSSIS